MRMWYKRTPLRMITMADLSAVAGRRVRSKVSVDVMNAFNKYAADYDITTRKRIAFFLAHVSVETGGFSAMSESMNYSVDGLKKTFGSHRISRDDCDRLGRKGSRRANQQEIANKVYGGSWGVKNLGNVQYGDGWKYRGAGPGQLTGRSHFQRAEEETGLPLIAQPELLRNVDTGMKATMMLWDRWDMNRYADTDQVTVSRKKWNGGTHGLAAVKAAWSRGLKRNMSIKESARVYVTPPKREKVVVKPSKSWWGVLLQKLLGGKP